MVDFVTHLTVANTGQVQCPWCTQDWRQDTGSSRRDQGPSVVLLCCWFNHRIFTCA